MNLSSYSTAGFNRGAPRWKETLWILVRSIFFLTSLLIPSRVRGLISKMCSILFISPSLTRRAGGIFEITKSLARHLAVAHGLSVEAIGLEDPANHMDRDEWFPVRTSVFSFHGPASFGYSPRLRAWIDGSTHDLAHLHALWMYTSVATRRWARRQGKPYIVTPNGMLDPWALRNSKWRKRFARLFYEDRTLRGAACLHANTMKELGDFRAYGLRNPVAVISNGVNLPADKQRVEGRTSVAAQSKVLLFLARIHPKKGLAELIEGWRISPARRNGWMLEIAGWDDGKHEAQLRAHCERLGLRSSVSWVGPQYGVNLANAYKRATAFILPSFSEGLPMAVLEAWSYGKPVLMTPHCNLQEGFAAQAALKIDPDPDSIAEGITRIVEMPGEELTAMGRRGRRLVEEKFSWPKVAADLKAVYDWVLGNTPKPECVVV
jgi:glycosyltransferase involved in cell wall biosynthesis